MPEEIRWILFVTIHLESMIFPSISVLYIPLKCNNCINTKIKSFSNNFLQLNENKTKVIVFNPSKSTKSTPRNLGPLTPYVKPHARDLSVIPDSNLNLDKQIIC